MGGALEPLGGTVGVRKGGDEFGFVVQGVPQEAVDAAMLSAREQFMALAATDGLADLPHTKTGGPAGVGFRVR